MASDFPAARVLLERAYGHLSGEDDISLKAREVLDLLVEAVVKGERKRPGGKIVAFPLDKRRDRQKI